MSFKRDDILFTEVMTANCHWNRRRCPQCSLAASFPGAM